MEDVKTRKKQLTLMLAQQEIDSMKEVAQAHDWTVSAYLRRLHRANVESLRSQQDRQPQEEAARSSQTGKGAARLRKK